MPLNLIIRKICKTRWYFLLNIESAGHISIAYAE